MPSSVTSTEFSEFKEISELLKITLLEENWEDVIVKKDNNEVFEIHYRLLGIEITFHPNWNMDIIDYDNKCQITIRYREELEHTRNLANDYFVEVCKYLFDPKPEKDYRWAETFTSFSKSKCLNPR